MPKSVFNLVSIADCLSITNALFGFIAIFFLLTNIAFVSQPAVNLELKFRIAFSFILLAILIDGLDGIVARKTKQSQIGEYLEAMADMTSLAIAPAIFIFIYYFGNRTCCVNYQIYLIIGLIYLIGLSILRLASFHVLKHKNYFIGIPASASTIILLTLTYLDQTTFINFRVSYILIAIVIISPALVTYIKFPKPDIRINGIAGVLILLTIIMDKSFYAIAPILLLTAILAYSIIGPIYVHKRM